MNQIRLFINNYPKVISVNFSINQLTCKRYTGNDASSDNNEFSLSNIKNINDKNPEDITDQQEDSLSVTDKLGGFAKAYLKQSSIDLNKEQNKKPDEKPKGPALPFITLLKNSKFVQLGDPHRKIVSGTIFHIVEDDLYIDFGGKFYCVCHRPHRNADDYITGIKVSLLLRELELSKRFLGSKTDVTLLEADATILGVLRHSNEDRTGNESATQQVL